LPEPPAAALRDYGNLVLLAPIHTLRGWDGRVCSSPNLNDCRKVSMPTNPAMRIARVQPVGDNDVWFKVEFGISACAGPAPPDSGVLTGWIPGYGSPNPSGKRPLTIWMDQHGC
jgi:hypothetical protein